MKANNTNYYTYVHGTANRKCKLRQLLATCYNGLRRDDAAGKYGFVNHPLHNPFRKEKRYMNSHFISTLRNGERYYREAGHNASARIFDNGGFTSTICTEDRTYNVITRIDEDAEVVLMEVSPGITCCKEAFAQVSEYIAKINASYKTCNLRIRSNGQLYMQTEQRFIDAPVDRATFERMEHNSLMILDTFAAVLEKLAHLKLIDADEADTDKVIQNHRKQALQNQGAEKADLSSLGEWGSQEDNDTSDIDESGFDGFDRIDEIISTQDEEIGKGLLASLLAISADESSENDDDGENDMTVLSDEKGGSSEEDADDADKEQ
jgi:hypothetical protein